MSSSETIATLRTSPNKHFLVSCSILANIIADVKVLLLPKRRASAQESQDIFLRVAVEAERSTTVLR